MSNENHPPDPAASAEWRRSYDLEVGTTMAKRLSLGGLIYLLSVAAFGSLELFHHGERGRLIAIRWSIEILICLWLVTAPRRLSAARARASGALCAAGLTVLAAVYSAMAGAEATRFANGEILLLSALAVIFPWGWRAQLFVAGVSFASFVVSLPHLTGPDVSYALLALVIGVVTSTFGAAFIDRHRFEAFVSARRAREEAEIATTLVRVGEVLSAQLGHDDMLDRVNLLALEALGSAASAILVWDHDRRTFVLRSVKGPPADPRSLARLHDVGFGAGALRLEQAARSSDGLYEIASVADEVWPVTDLLRALGATSALVAPMSRSDDVVGVLLSAWPSPAIPSPAQRRIAVGIAQATAIALENARLIQQLQDASQLKSEFVSTISHELRTPLNVILGFNEMAREPDLEPRERDELLARVDAAGRDLLMLIEDTLELGRIESGRDAVRLERVQLAALWRVVGASVARIPKDDRVALEWSDRVPDVRLLTDPRKLTVILRNLAGNALKFTEQGSVRVGATLRDGILELEIADTGIGIAPDAQAVVFEMFRQGDGSDSRRHGGVGLGLHIVRRFVQQLGGAVELESTLGVGATFRVRLPATLLDAVEASPPGVGAVA